MLRVAVSVDTLLRPTVAPVANAFVEPLKAR